MNEPTSGDGVMILVIVAVVLAFIATGSCEDPEGARRALIEEGLQPISVGGYGWGECGRGDYVATKFTAERPDGRVVEGVVCGTGRGLPADVRMRY